MKINNVYGINDVGEFEINHDESDDDEEIGE